jgi:hypothetical protein
LLRAKVIACCFNASVAVGFDLVARGVSRLVCQRQFTIDFNMFNYIKNVIQNDRVSLMLNLFLFLKLFKSLDRFFTSKNRIIIDEIK